MLAGTLGGLLATWVTFTPCFLWIFLGAPFIEAMRGNRALAGALSTITAAVVGVVLNLAIWFAIHTMFRQVEPLRFHGVSFDAPALSSIESVGVRLIRCSRNRDLPLQGRNAFGPCGMLLYWRPSLSARSRWMMWFCLQNAPGGRLECLRHEELG